MSTFYALSFIFLLDHQEQVSLKDFLMPGLYKPLIIGCTLMVFQQFCGVNAVLFFDSEIFSPAGFKDSNEVSLSVAGAMFVATGIGCIIVDKSGRKILLFSGGIVMGISLLLLGVYFDLARINSDIANKVSIFKEYSHTIPPDHISWLAVLSAIIYIVMFSVGWGPLPWLLMSEIFSPRTRGFASGIVTLVNWSLVFVIAMSFKSMKNSMSPQGAFWFFAFISFLSALYTLFFVPETKGKSLEEIELIFTRGASSVQT